MGDMDISVRDLCSARKYSARFYMAVAVADAKSAFPYALGMFVGDSDKTRSRQFGFVGFRTEEEAVVAIKYFDRSYLRTCQLSCQVFFRTCSP